VDRPADRVLQRVHQGDADVGERQAGDRRPECHALARLQVVAVLDGPPQVPADQPDRRLRAGVADRVPALVHRPLT
jgi:hypothetical protein